jgi:pSer/pThr/pTyr-binding forkhead associated (FHA) protein
MPKLIVTLSNGTNVTHELSEDTITVGRISDNTLQIEEASVSSHHAEFVASGDHHILRDLDSTNGTRVNGQVFSEGPVKDSDRIRFGQIECRYVSENPDDARPLPEQQLVAAAVAESSVRPDDFTNASPFKSKNRKKDPVSLGILVFAGVSVLVFIGAMLSIFQLQPPGQ